MKRLVLFALSLSALLMFQCRQVEIPEPVAGDPVFFISGTLGSEPFQWTAGEEGYYMATSYEQDSNGLYFYSGSMEELECTTSCQPSLAIHFRNAVPGLPLPDSTLEVKAYEFYEEVEPQQEIRYRLRFSGQGINTQGPSDLAYAWNFGGGLTSTDQNPELEFLNEAGRYVQLETTDSFGCSSLIERWVSFEDNGSSCELDFSIEPIQGNQFVLATIDQFPSGFLFGFWNNGDSLDFTTQYGPILPGETPLICATASGSDSCTVTNCQQLYSEQSPAGQVLFFCKTDFSYTVERDTIFLPPPSQPGAVWATYRDADGITYNSAWGSQAASAFFEVSSVETYDNNENGQPTKRYEYRFQCALFDEGGQELGLISAEGAYGIAHP